MHPLPPSSQKNLIFFGRVGGFSHSQPKNMLSSLILEGEWLLMKKNNYWFGHANEAIKYLLNTQLIRANVFFCPLFKWKQGYMHLKF